MANDGSRFDALLKTLKKHAAIKNLVKKKLT